MSSSFDKEYRSTFDKLVEYTDEKTKRDFFKQKKDLFIAKQNNFLKVADFIYAYWVSNTVFSILKNAQALNSIAEAKKGLTTGNNDKFVRVWFEVDSNEISYMKG